MTLPHGLFENPSWAGIVLIQATLIALLGMAAWLAVRRRSPALRGAVILATLAGLVVAPVLAAAIPTWLPLPEWLSPPTVAIAHVDATDPPPGPATAVEPSAPEILVRPSLAPPVNADGSTQQIGENTPMKTRAEAVLLNPPSGPQPASPVTVAEEPASPSWSIPQQFLALWLIGAIVCLGRTLWRLARLYDCSRRARPIHDQEWMACVACLAERQGLGVVALRESPAIASPLTLGLFRPTILLPIGRRHWFTEQRSLILSHELAHVRRGDFAAGLLAELVLCICWLHPLVRWLAARLRLEQEYAADAWVASAAGDATNYVRCLARLALERDRGRASLAPALWRRRPEILRRIDMLRRNPKGCGLRIGKRTGWALLGLATAVCLVVAGVGPLRSSAEEPKAAESNEPKATVDAQGDPLPDGALARLGTTRLRHGADVTYVAFGPEGKTLITAGQDNTIRLWDLNSRKEIRRFSRTRPPALKPIDKPKDKPSEKDAAEAMLQIMSGAHNDSGTLRVAVTADGKSVAAVSGNSIQLWDVGTGKEIRRIEEAPGGLAGLLFSPDGRTLAGRGSGGGLFLWSAESGKLMHQIKPARRPSAGNEIQLTLGGTPEIPPGMAFSPDSKTLAAAATEFNQQEAIRLVKIWDTTSGKEVSKITVPEGASVSAVAVAPDGKTLAYGAGNAIHVCEVETGKQIHQLKPADGGVMALVFALDGKTLAVRGRNQRVRLWDAQTGKEREQLNDSEPAAQQGGAVAMLGGGYSGPEVRALAVSGDGKTLASAVGSTVRLWDAATGKEMPFLGGHWRAPAAIVLSPDGKTAVTWGFDRMVRRWDAASGKLLESFPAPARSTVAAFSADGRTVAFANADNTIRLHDTATGKETGRLKGHENGIAALAFARDGKTLASRGSGDGTIRLHDIGGSAELRRIVVRPKGNPREGEFVLVLGGSPRASRGTGPGVTFSPDGRLVIAPLTADGEPTSVLVLFDAATGKELRKIESGRPIQSFAVSADGRTLATENVDRTITLWEVASGKERGQLGKAVNQKPLPNDGVMRFTVVADGITAGGFSQPGGPVGLTFSPDGRLLAVRGPDLTVRVWDVNAGRELGKLEGHTGGIETVSFASDGKSVASGARDTTVLLWDASRTLKNLANTPTLQLADTEIDKIWADLAGADAAKAREGVHRLAAAPKQVVPFLAGRLQPMPRVDAQKLNAWLAALESEKYAVRQEAIGNLLKTGEQAIPVLQGKLASAPPLETRKRVEELLNRLTSGDLTTEQVRLVRAVETLEQIASKESRQVLQRLANGAPGTLPTREAQGALARMKGAQ